MFDVAAFGRLSCVAVVVGGLAITAHLGRQDAHTVGPRTSVGACTLSLLARVRLPTRRVDMDLPDEFGWALAADERARDALPADVVLDKHLDKAPGRDREHEESPKVHGRLCGCWCACGAPV